MFFPEKDTPVAHRHAQTALSFGAYPRLLSSKNRSENLVSGRIHVLLPVLFRLNVQNVFGINPA